MKEPFLTRIGPLTTLPFPAAPLWSSPASVLDVGRNLMGNTCTPLPSMRARIRLDTIPSRRTLHQNRCLDFRITLSSSWELARKTRGFSLPSLSSTCPNSNAVRTTRWLGQSRARNLRLCSETRFPSPLLVLEDCCFFFLLTVVQDSERDGWHGCGSLVVTFCLGSFCFGSKSWPFAAASTRPCNRRSKPSLEVWMPKNGTPLWR